MPPFVDHGAVLPRLSRAQAPLTREVLAVNEFGETERLSIPAERALTVYVDKRELVTLMTLGAHPELLVLGYLRNQRLLTSPFEVESITVDWDVGAAAVKTHRGVDRIEEKTARRVVTTGCGQGSVFGELMDEIDGIELPAATLSQAQLYGIVNAIRLQESTYKSAGSVHGCALFRGEEMLVFVEDVGRHNAIDTIAGWMWMRQEAPTGATGCAALPHEGVLAPSGDPAAPDGLSEMALSGADKVFYTTGRLTSEMVMKAAQLGVPIIVSRNGVTAMGHELASRLGMALFGRAANRHFLCYTGTERFDSEPEPQRTAVRVVAG